MARTPTMPVTDGAMWRKLLARAHPDAGGCHELFIWVEALRERVVGEQQASSGGPAGGNRRREEPGEQGQGQARVPFDPGADFDLLTRRALSLAVDVAEPFSGLLGLLDGVESEGGAQERVGVTYKTLALVAHRAGLDKKERATWYRIAERVPLSQRHAGAIIERLVEMGRT